MQILRFFKKLKVPRPARCKQEIDFDHCELNAEDRDMLDDPVLFFLCFRRNLFYHQNMISIQIHWVNLVSNLIGAYGLE